MAAWMGGPGWGATGGFALGCVKREMPLGHQGDGQGLGESGVQRRWPGRRYKLDS